MPSDVYDFIGVGLGPFNLSLACLSAPIKGLRHIFLERGKDFNWHPGLMLQDATLQNPFLADLVSLADPRSEFSYLNYCKRVGRLYSCYMREKLYLSRREYNRYCQWAVSQLSSVRFGYHVQSVDYDDDAGVYIVSGRGPCAEEPFRYRCRRLVLGVGAQPAVPACCERLGTSLVHSADYLSHKSQMLEKRSITVVGSGQSAAEVFYDLLRHSDQCAFSLAWITRSSRFFQMEDSKLTLELISPDYARYFSGLSLTRRQGIIERQSSLYKGINASLINDIYDLLDEKFRTGDNRYTLLTNADLRTAEYDECRDEYTLGFHHVEADRAFTHRTDGLILATGYVNKVPVFIDRLRERIRWSGPGTYEVADNYSIDVHCREIFVQNCDLLSHGVTSPDIGFCCHRNSVILRAITGVEHYSVEQSTALQDFSPPDDGELRHRSNATPEQALPKKEISRVARLTD